MPKLPAPPRRPQKQVGVLGLARVDEPTVRGDHVGADEVVAGETVLAHQPADAAAEREAGDARGRDQPAGRGQGVRLRLVVDVAPDRTRGRRRRAVRAGSTRTERIADRSITIPSSQLENPAML